MIDNQIIIACTAIYLAVMFFIAYRGDAQASGHVSRFQPLIYTLSLTVYCTSWTFYGAVGNAAHNGWDYFSIYLGPIIVFTVFFPFIRKLIAVSKRHKITTIADFIATRYGKSNRLAAMVTVIALLGSLPYIALQIKAISSAYDTLVGVQEGASFSLATDTAFVLSVILAVFSILFGARTIDASEHHRGLLHAISFESIVKLIAFMAIAVLALQIVMATAEQNNNGLSSLDMLMQPFTAFTLSTAVFTKLLLAAAAIVCLPRQFHVLAVEARGGESAARWGLPLYLLLFSLAVVPITAAGNLIVHGLDNADLYVLTLPMVSGSAFLSVVSYLGGFAAATGMVIVATVALSTMVSNDLIFPVVVRFKKDVSERSFHSTLLLIRRTTIFILMLLAYGFYQLGGAEKSLQSIGLISFAAAIQFLPSIVGGLYWNRGHRNGAMAGLSIGFLIWLYSLLLPSLANSVWIPAAFVALLNDQTSLINPYQLLGMSFADPLTHGVFWSLLANISAYIYFSFRAQSSLTDRLQATSYINLLDAPKQYPTPTSHRLLVSDLYELCSRFTGEKRTREYFSEHGYDVDELADNTADPRMQALSERLLAGSIGTATAEHLIRTAYASDQRSGDQLYELIDQTGQAIEFNRELLQVTLDHIGQAVSVVDRDLRLVAWNRLYVELFDYPSGFIRVGKPIEDVIRFNVTRGYGPALDGSLEDRINRRLHYLKHGEHYTFVRDWQNGQVMQTQGARMPDGGYITTYTNITPLKMAERILEKSNEELEAKVVERTQMLSTVNTQLEEAVSSKTHFLAAASHDLVQPLSASKLYMGALLEDLSEDESKQDLARNALGALKTAESLLKSLLDLSKLDSGVLKPDIRKFSLNSLFNAIENEFSVIAADKEIQFKVIKTKFITESDKTLLLSILQNLVSNAIRYADDGAVMVVCRRDGDQRLRIEVRDSGPGIPLDMQEEIFHAFKQLDKKTKAGVGLGLAISREASILLGHNISVKSAPGCGSVFSVVVPKRKLVIEQEGGGMPLQTFDKRWLEGVRILCVDDDREILQASKSLLERWGADITCLDEANRLSQLVKEEPDFDVVLMDYQLGVEMNGLDLLQICRQTYGENFYGVLVTAEIDTSLEQKAIDGHYGFLAKPVEPAKLRSILQSALRPIR